MDQKLKRREGKRGKEREEQARGKEKGGKERVGRMIGLKIEKRRTVFLQNFTQIAVH